MLLFLVVNIYIVTVQYGKSRLCICLYRVVILLYAEYCLKLVELLVEIFLNETPLTVQAPSRLRQRTTRTFNFHCNLFQNIPTAYKLVESAQYSTGNSVSSLCNLVHYSNRLIETHLP